MAEAGVVYSTAILLTMGTIAAGLGVFRYQEVAYQARQAARWASLQSSTPTAQAVKSGAMTLIALDPTALTVSVSKTTINAVDYTAVTLTYQWTPSVLSSVLTPITFHSTSQQPTPP